MSQLILVVPIVCHETSASDLTIVIWIRLGLVKDMPKIDGRRKIPRSGLLFVCLRQGVDELLSFFTAKRQQFCGDRPLGVGGHFRGVSQYTNHLSSGACLLLRHRHLVLEPQIDPAHPGKKCAPEGSRWKTAFVGVLGVYVISLAR